MKLGWRFRQPDSPLGVVTKRASGKIARTVERVNLPLGVDDDPTPQGRRPILREQRVEQPDVENLVGQEHLLKSRRVDAMASRPPLKKVRIM